MYSALDETSSKGVYRISEGVYSTLKDNELSIKKYWDMDSKANNLSFEDTVLLFDKSVSECVELHRILDVEVGSRFLLGVDLSYITALCWPEHTSSIGFDNKKYVEGVAAKELCDKLGLDNTSDIVTEKEALDNSPLI